MKRIVSLSIHLGHFPLLGRSEVPEVESFRAFLWNNFIPKHDHALWVAEFTHPNIFALLKELKRSALAWSALHGDQPIVGIHDGAPCWPIDGALSHLPPIDLDVAVHRKIVHWGGFRGLLGLIRPASAGHEIKVYDVLPLPQHAAVADSLVNCSYWSPNAFVAAEHLQTMLRASAGRLGLHGVSGLDDEEECWPQDFGECRHS
ncbi:MAG: hypothetical protein WC250_02965 [Candidatus Paceibacterota bacterium]|jgi:hypothetical protein